MTCCYLIFKKIRDKIVSDFMITFIWEEIKKLYLFVLEQWSDKMHANNWLPTEIDQSIVHKPKSVFENRKMTILEFFEIQTDCPS